MNLYTLRKVSQNLLILYNFILIIILLSPYCDFFISQLFIFPVNKNISPLSLYSEPLFQLEATVKYHERVG